MRFLCSFYPNFAEFSALSNMLAPSWREHFNESSRLGISAFADGVEGAFDECLTLFADVVVDGGHGLDGAGCRTGEGEFAVGDFALVQGKCAVTEDDEAAIGEGAAFVFVEIEDNFFVCKMIFRNFHKCFW